MTELINKLKELDFEIWGFSYRYLVTIGCIISVGVDSDCLKIESWEVIYCGTEFEEYNELKNDVEVKNEIDRIFKELKEFME